MKQKTKTIRGGFTLIEVIITLVVLAIVVAMMAPYLGTSFTQSGTPVSRLNTSMSLNTIIEKISVQYSQYTHWRPPPLLWSPPPPSRSSNTAYAVNTIVLPAARNGFQYICITAGTSGATVPAWPTATGATVNDGTVVWSQNGPAPYVLGAIVLPVTRNGFQYICITAGLSGIAEPVWPTATGGTVNDGAVVWKQNGSAPSYAVGTIVLPTTRLRNGFQYTCSTAGTSGDKEPNWPIPGQMVGASNHVCTSPPDAACTVIEGATRSSNTAYTRNNVVHPASPNGFQYICITAGTSGAATPVWPTGNGATVNDGTVVWKQNGPAPVWYLSGKEQTLIDLQTNIGAAGGGENQDYIKGTPPNYPDGFGAYRVIQNRFIKFDPTTNPPNQEVNINDTPTDPEYGRYLKVTIGFPLNAPGRTGETVTTLFVMR